MEKIKEFRVQSNSNYLIWKIDTTNFADKVKFYVDTGCSLLYYESGGYCNEYQPGSSYDIDLKKSAKKGKVVGLFGVNSEYEFKIRIGVGFQFRDCSVKSDPVHVGIHGAFTLRVLNGAKLRNKFGAFKELITAEDVKSKLEEDLIARLNPVLLKELRKYTYDTLWSATIEVSKTGEEELRKLFQEEGLLLIRCSFDSPYFPDGYPKQRNGEDDLSFLIELNKKGITANGGDKEQTCPNCGREIK